jgi:hypothetical protein
MAFGKGIDKYDWQRHSNVLSVCFRLPMLHLKGEGYAVAGFIGRPGSALLGLVY